MTEVIIPPKLIRASAGTGKTFSLTNRYLKLLALGERPERILATTFTRKAAGEIQERIFTRLAEASVSEVACTQLQEFIDEPEFSPERARELLHQLIREQHRLNVCTLDSFFLTLAMSFSLELGLVPGWGISSPADEVTVQAEAIRKASQDLPRDVLAELLRQIEKGDHRYAIHSRIKSKVEALYDLFRAAPAAAWEWLEAPPRVTEREQQELIERFQAFEVPKTQKGDPNKTWQKAIDKIQEQLAAAEWDALYVGGPLKSLLEGKDKFSSKPLEPYIEDFDLLLDAVRRETLADLAIQNSSAYRLLYVYDLCLNALKKIRRLLSFDDIKNLLRFSAVTGELDTLYYRLDAALHHLLLDEFQDTSVEQWEVLAPFADEILSHGDTERSFFCVGDVKQAIYGWRGGEAAIFDSLTERWNVIQEEGLEKSYRSSPVIIRCVNTVFGNISSNAALQQYPEATQHWQERFSQHETAKEELPGYAELLVLEKKAEQSTYQIAAKLIKELHEKAPHLSIGVLCLRNRGIKEMMYELRRDEIGIAASEEGGNPIKDSPAVAVVNSLLTFAVHPGDSVASFHISISPLGAAYQIERDMSPGRAETKSRRIREMIQERGFGGFLYEVTQQLTGHYPERDIQRLQQLVELGHSFDQEGGTSLYEFLHQLENYKVEDPTAAPVRVMTIHGSKGLEFDAVVLPELNRTFLSRVGSDAMTFREDPLGPPSMVTMGLPKLLRGLSSELTAMHEQETNRALEEALSVLYVALTRARHGLYMITKEATIESDAPSFEKILQAVLAPEGASSPLYAEGDPGWYTKVESSEFAQSPVERQAEVKIEFSKPDSRPRSYSRMTPSKLEGGGNPPASVVLEYAGDATATRGEILHQLFEQVEFEADLDARDEVIQAAGLEFSLDQSLRAEFDRMCQAPEIVSALSRSRYDDELMLYRECPFAYRVGDSIMSGAIDRLVVCIEDGAPVRAEVIDYKSDFIAHNDSEALAEKIEYYRPQLEHYRVAASKIIGLPEEKVSMFLLFLGPGKLCEVS